MFSVFYNGPNCVGDDDGLYSTCIYVTTAESLNILLQPRERNRNNAYVIMS